MKIYSEEELKEAHSSHRCTKKDIEESTFCGCFYCCKSFRPKNKPIKEWIGTNKDPLCPICNIDSVIPGISGFPVTNVNFLKQMYKRWFSISKSQKKQG